MTRVGDLGQFGQGVDGQGARRHHPVGRGVVDDGAVGAHRHRREPECLDDGPYPARRTAGRHDELRTSGDGGTHRVTGARGDGFVVVEQGAVDVAGDQRRQGHRGGPPLSAVSAIPPWVCPGRVTPSVPYFLARSANSASRIALESSWARRGATQPPRHPELPFGMRIFLLHPVQHRVHRLPQRGVELLGGALRRHRPAGGHGDRNLVAEHLLWMILGPNPVRAPDNHRNYRHLRLQRQPRRPGLELPEFVTAADGGLGMQPDELALPQPLHGHRVRVVRPSVRSTGMSWQCLIT